MKLNQPNNQIFWSLETTPSYQPCIGHIEADVVIIGGGIAGLSAAQTFAKRNKKTVLLEKKTCGSGATGKSSGFITPNAELSLSDFEKHTNKDTAQKMWKFIHEGMETIRNNIKKYNFNCEYKENAGLFLANCQRTLKNLKKEHEYLLNIDQKSIFFNKQNLSSIINSSTYVGGITYENNFSINPFKYCSALKQHLVSQGVQVFENSPVKEIKNHTVTTEKGTVNAQYIIICIDKFSPDLGIFKDLVYHAQNYILVSQPLNDDQIKQVFPQQQYMAWDSKLIYNYFRFTEDNRFLIGGGDFFSIYSKEKHNYAYGRNKLDRYIKQTFPQLQFTWEYQWPGLIGISKDITPLAGPDKKHPHIYYIAGAAGLPIATALAHYSTEHLLDKRNDLDLLFNPERQYFIGNTTQKILGKKLSFAINNFISQDTVGCF